MRHTKGSRTALALLALLLLQGTATLALADTPAAILAKYEQLAGAPGSPERGKELFTKDYKQVLGWTCSSCHTANPRLRGTDQLKEKPLAPLAPSANPKRLTDAAKVENAFALNCVDVVGRKCTPQEKADVLAWLISAGKN
jgi:uncharacterized membrane protein